MEVKNRLIINTESYDYFKYFEEKTKQPFKAINKMGY